MSSHYRKRKRVPRSQPPRPSKDEQAEAVGSRRQVSKRFVELVRSQMFHRK